MTEQIMDLSRYDGDGFENVVVSVKAKYMGQHRYFPSNSQNSFIVNAETGVAYPWRVGSRDSLRLFKMIDTTGVYDKKGFKIDCKSDEYPNRNPNHIYYDSPDQFMKHQRTTLNPSMITAFKNRVADII